MHRDALTDIEFLDAFERCEIPNHAFRHIDHLRMCFLYLNLNPFEQAGEKIVSGIQRFAEFHRVPKLYHHTITWFWIYAVDACRKRTHAENFSGFIEQNPNLKNKDYIFEFYSKELLLSEKARQGWVDPELKKEDSPRITQRARSNLLIL
jgi:hypothetical protein